MAKVLASEAAWETTRAAAADHQPPDLDVRTALGQDPQVRARVDRLRPGLGHRRGAGGATPVRASYGTRPVPVLQPATNEAYRQLARQRLKHYSQQHAEQAAVDPSNWMPWNYKDQLTSSRAD